MVPLDGALPVSGSASPFLTAALLAACVAAAPAAAQGTRVQSIRITATIASPVGGLAADVLAPELRPIEAPHAAAPRATDRSRARGAAVEPTATQRVTERAASAPARYRVVVRLAADAALPDGVSLVLADADGGEWALAPGQAVTIARGVTASEARAAVVRLRVRNGTVEEGGASAIPLVYEVTSESALAM